MLHGAKFWNDSTTENGILSSAGWSGKDCHARVSVVLDSSGAGSEAGKDRDR